VLGANGAAAVQGALIDKLTEHQLNTIQTRLHSTRMMLEVEDLTHASAREHSEKTTARRTALGLPSVR
jgi:hypothetical protein